MQAQAHMATDKEYGIGRAAAEAACAWAADLMSVPMPNAMAFVAMGCAKLFHDAQHAIPLALSGELFRALGDWLSASPDDTAAREAAAGRVCEAMNAISMIDAGEPTQ